MIYLKTQLQYFKKLEKLLREKLGDAETKTFLARAGYFINIGFDDYGVLLFTTNSSALQSYPQEEYVDMVIGNLTSVIKVIKI